VGQQAAIVSGEDDEDDKGTERGRKAEPEASCPADAFAGTWTFSARVLGAENPRMIGVEGHFDMKVTVKDCAAAAELTKTGYNLVGWGDDKRQRGPVTFSEVLGVRLLQGTAKLRSKVANEEIELVLEAQDGQLLGWWRKAEGGGPVRSGVVVGSRGGTRPTPSAAAGPLACVLACDDASGATDGGAQCKPDQTCGAKPLPSAFDLPVDRTATLAEFCADKKKEKTDEFGGDVDVTCGAATTWSPASGGSKKRFPKVSGKDHQWAAVEYTSMVGAGEDAYLGLKTGGTIHWVPVTTSYTSGAGSSGNGPTRLVEWTDDVHPAGGGEVVLIAETLDYDVDYDAESTIAAKEISLCRDADGGGLRCVRLKVGAETSDKDGSNTKSASSSPRAYVSPLGTIRVAGDASDQGVAKSVGNWAW